MQRITITVDDELAEDIDAFMAAHDYANRSEAIRDLARESLERHKRAAPSDANCVAALIYTFDHNERDLPKRLTKEFHAHHDIAQTTLHVHLDHARCMEISVLKGPQKAVRAFADHVIAERGVRNGSVFFVPDPATKPARRRRAHAHEHTH